MTVFDSSALLSFLKEEAGADLVATALEEGGVCGAANWSEVAQKIRYAGVDWDLVRGLLLSYQLKIEPVTAQDAERAAELWIAGEGLSLGDRLCLALGERCGAIAFTADARWGDRQGVRLIR